MATVQVDLMHTSKARNSTRVPSTTEGHITETICYLKEPTSIIKPILIIQGADSTFEGKQFPDYNYCYIKDFHRYYFITNITSISALVWQIDCEVDVLATYRTEILGTKAFIMYAESMHNSMIPDDRLPRTDKSTTSVLQVAFDAYSRAGIFVITVIGKDGNGQNGYTQSYALGASQLKALGDAINDQSIWDSMKIQLNDPLATVVSCVWLPIRGDKIDTSPKGIYLGYHDVGVTGNILNSTYVEGSFTIAIPLHYKSLSGSFADYRNCEPFSNATITLPGVGNVQIPLIRVLKDGSKQPSISVEYCIDVTTGQVTYVLHDPDDPDGIILTATGSFGVSIPVSSSSSNAIGELTGVTGTIGSTIGMVASAATGNMVAAAAFTGGMMSGVISSTISANQISTSVSGGIGGRSAISLNEHVTVTVWWYEVSDSPANCISTIGLPLFKTLTLGSLKGLVKCTGVYVEAECTDEEHNMLAQYVNASTNYIYGGLIIE